MGPHVFGDGRLGLWIVNPAYLTDRLPKIKALGGITDLFLPPTAEPAHMQLVRDFNLFAHLYFLPTDQQPELLARDVLAAIDRLQPGAIELNVERPDEVQSEYIRKLVTSIRQKRPKFRIRLNIAPFKGSTLPIDLLVYDPNLYVVAQAYFGNMDGRASESECFADLEDWGVPRKKAGICYGAHVSPNPGQPRQPALPAFRIKAIRRGILYTDDLMVDAGYL